MQKNFNILVILVLIACARSTKSISYSDIVTSFVELSDNNDQALNHVVTIAENFEQSNNLLRNLKTEITENCQQYSSRAAKHQNYYQNQIASFENAVTYMTEESQKLSSSVLADEQLVKAEVVKIKSTKDEIKAAQQEVLDNEKAIHESVNVLKRLRNIAIDELQGTEQRNSQINAFNIKARTPPTAFIQFLDFHSELKNLLSKTDSVNRGFISTLILLTQSAGKQTFSNPETVKKIVAMIDKILATSYLKIQTNQSEGEAKISSYSAIIENSRAIIAKLKDGIQSAIALRAAAGDSIVFIRNEIVFLQRGLNRREKRNAFSLNLCKEQSNLVDRHFKKYVESLEFVNNLKSSLTVE